MNNKTYRAQPECAASITFNMTVIISGALHEIDIITEMALDLIGHYSLAWMSENEL